MKSIPTAAEINNLFANSDPGTVWTKSAGILRRINPVYDTTPIKSVFDDIMSLFRGDYPGYSSIKTLYHDKPHTLDVFLCAVRLMHGVHLSGTRLSDEELTLIMIATLMHDIGYSQLEGEEGGTGAQYTQTHVKRGIAFMKKYIAERNLPAKFAITLEPMISGTDAALKFPEIGFPDDRTRLLGQIVATADLTGQMADRTYLEKLLFLYLEFREANFGNYQNMYDLLRQTSSFYATTREKLDGALGGMYTRFSFHFEDVMGVDNNYYLESIEKNIAYLSKVVALNEQEYLSMLKRGGIAEKSRVLVAHL
ncbi:MAG TPA: HD domain-containing protein [Gallionella sp.]|nr:HD domain-containing protein [Gallionella sp.]